jgi:hypothetical protein
MDNLMGVASKYRKTKKKKNAKMEKVMSEFKAGTLRSSSGKKVTSRAQAIAIGMNYK